MFLWIGFRVNRGKLVKKSYLLRHGVGFVFSDSYLPLYYLITIAVESESLSTLYTASKVKVDSFLLKGITTTHL